MTTNEFLTAEHSTNPKSGTWVMLQIYSVNLGDQGGVVPSRFIVTTSTGYRAELPACFRGEHVGRREICLKEVGGGRCLASRHCHNGHLEHAEAFRDKVSATFIKKAPVAAPSLIEVRPPALVKVRRGGGYKPEVIAELLGMTLADYQAELSKARA